MRIPLFQNPGMPGGQRAGETTVEKQRTAEAGEPVAAPPNKVAVKKAPLEEERSIPNDAPESEDSHSRQHWWDLLRYWLGELAWRRRFWSLHSRQQNRAGEERS